MIVLPIIADLQHEYTAARPGAVMRPLILLRGYWSFWKAVGLLTFVTGDWKMRINKLTGIDAFTFVLVLIAAFLLIRPGYLLNPNSNHSMIFWSVQLLGCLAGLALALAARVRMTAYCIAAFVAFTTSEMAIQAYYQSRTLILRGDVQIPVRIFRGALFPAAVPAHYAVMGAALLGVALGAALAIWGSKFAFRIRVRQSGSEAGNP